MQTETKRIYYRTLFSRCENGLVRMKCGRCLKNTETSCHDNRETHYHDGRSTGGGDTGGGGVRVRKLFEADVYLKGEQA
jgi:hypothetical protein